MKTLTERIKILRCMAHRNGDYSEGFTNMAAEHDAVMAQMAEALKWAIPLARSAIEATRIIRLECGHRDIVGEFKDGKKLVGIWQNEVDEIEAAESALHSYKSLGEK